MSLKKNHGLKSYLLDKPEHFLGPTYTLCTDCIGEAGIVKAGDEDKEQGCRQIFGGNEDHHERNTLLGPLVDTGRK